MLGIYGAELGHESEGDVLGRTRRDGYGKA